MKTIIISYFAFLITSVLSSDECEFEAGSHYSLWQRTQAKTSKECESDCFSYAHSKDNNNCQALEVNLSQKIVVL